MDTSNLIISITLHIFLLFVFLSILFWIIISPTESRSLTHELDKSINEIDYKQSVPKELKNYLLNVYSNQNITQETNNTMLFHLNIIMIIFLFIILVTQILFQSLSGSSIKYVEIISENVIILIFVGIIEFLFFKNIASHYIPVKPSYMTHVIEQNINTA